VRLARALDEPTTQLAEDWLLHVANMPSRKLPRQQLSQALRSARFHQATPRQALADLVDDPRSPLYPSQQERAIELVAVLDALRQRMTEEAGLMAGHLLLWLVERIGYLDHFTQYYGDGWEAFDRQRAVRNFLNYAQGTGLPAKEFLQHITKLDTTRGVPEEQQIVLTTIFREKGCEYDYVFIPDCIEGYLPCLRESGSLIFDTAGLIAEPEPSKAIENERRLFYVALTRARRAVYIGTAAAPRSSGDALRSRFLDELQLTATTQLMGALQRLAAGEGTADDLLKRVRRFGGAHKVMKHLRVEYLKDVGDKALSRQVAQIAAARSEVPFAYRFAFTPPTIPAAQRPHPAPALHRAWDSVAF